MTALNQDTPKTAAPNTATQETAAPKTVASKTVASKTPASKAAASETPLRSTFRIRLNGETVAIATVGQAYRFLTEYSSIEWMECRTLHGEAMELLERAADNAMLTVQATNAVRVLFVSTKLL